MKTREFPRRSGRETEKLETAVFGNQGQQEQQGGDDIFDMIGSAEVPQGGIYLLPGNFVLAVDLFKMVRSKRDNHRKFIAEFVVLKSDNAQRPAGTKVGWARDLDGRFPKENAGEVRGLLAASANVEIEEVDSKGSRYAVSADNPAHGRVLRCEAFQKEGKTFTNTRFFSMDEAAQAHGAEMLKASGKVGGDAAWAAADDRAPF